MRTYVHLSGPSVVRTVVAAVHARYNASCGEVGQNAAQCTARYCRGTVLAVDTTVHIATDNERSGHAQAI